jgi:hypothetical protein
VEGEGGIDYTTLVYCELLEDSHVRQIPRAFAHADASFLLAIRICIRIRRHA